MKMTSNRSGTRMVLRSTSKSPWHVSSSVSLKEESVGQRPTFIQPISSCRVCSGESVRFQARVSGRPKPEIQWFHNQQLMLPKKDLVFHFDESTGTAILIIVDAFLEHAGQYSCKARNSAGETTCTATLTVTAEGKRRGPRNGKENENFALVETEQDFLLYYQVINMKAYFVLYF
uniref:Ig-like domain-containing protein n=1 Tax=Zonotrichia albicollis TaxID=44394 RepID=A0A8D2QK57_ZONAL